MLIEPAKAFVDAVGERLDDEVASGLTAKPAVNGSIRRLNRDLRFSADKTPYNARLHLIFWGGPKPNQGSAFHLVIAPDHVGVGAGQWQFTPAQLVAYRSALSNPARAQALDQAVATAREAGVGDLDGPHLKRQPAGFQAAPGYDYGMARPSLERSARIALSTNERGTDRCRFLMLGIDLGKNVCSLVGLDKAGTVVLQPAASS